MLNLVEVVDWSSDARYVIIDYKPSAVKLMIIINQPPQR